MHLNIIHGGDLDLIEKKYKIPKNEILDFSSNINPLGSPKSVKDKLIKNIDIIETYPDKNYENLKLNISSYTNCSFEHILVGNGATEIITSLIQSLNPKNSMLILPSYSEYEKELKKIKCKINFFYSYEEDDFKININNLLNKLTNEMDLLILCNPNNPTGFYLDNSNLEIILSHCKKNNIFVMIDETYAEFLTFDKNSSAINLTKKFSNLFVIRGTSKFFAVPGIRLGYAICSNNNLLDLINKNFDLWNVNSFANLAGITMFNDTKFINDSKALIKNELNNFFVSLNQLSKLKLFKTSSNFILCKILTDKIKSYEIFEILIKQKILIRDAKDFDGLNTSFFRFCIKTPEQNSILIKNLKNISILH